MLFAPRPAHQDSRRKRMLFSVLRNAIPLLLPLVRRHDNAELMERLPRLPIKLPHESGWQSLREAAGRDSLLFFFNFLRHVSERGDLAYVQERIDQYFINPIVRSELQRKWVRATLGVPGISSITITPTVICNLHCDWCYNLYEIHQERNETLSDETMDRVVREARDLGAWRVSLIGGEPLIVWQQLDRLFEKHPDVLFTVITNGTLLTDEIATCFARRGNVEMAFSVDGLRERHEASRGEGTFDPVIEAMRRYRAAGGMVLFSPTVTADNHQELLSAPFLDLMEDCGAYMGYFHHYDLVGGQHRVEHLLTREQQIWMSDAIGRIHGRRSISILSNVVSNLMSGGCPAVKEFVHVNHRGEVEACCMVPFAADSVNDKPLLEVLQSSFFQRLDRVERDEGGIKRCLAGENSAHLQAAVAAGEARASHDQANEMFGHAVLAEQADRVLPTCFSLKS